MSPSEYNAILISCKVALVAVLCSLPFGVILGWILARKSIPAKSLIETLVNLPLVLPPVVTGYLLLVTFGRNGLLGAPLENWLGVRLIFDWKGAALAAAVVSFPLMVRSIRIAFAATDPKLEQVARTLGAGPVDTFFSISVPLARNGIIAGCLLAFARCLGEFGATIMIAGNIPGETRTIPLFVYDQLETPGGFENCWTVIWFSVLLSAAALFISEVLERRVRERQGR